MEKQPARVSARELFVRCSLIWRVFCHLEGHRHAERRREMPDLKISMKCIKQEAKQARQAVPVRLKATAE